MSIGGGVDMGVDVSRGGEYVRDISHDECNVIYSFPLHDRMTDRQTPVKTSPSRNLVCLR